MTTEPNTGITMAGEKFTIDPDRIKSVDVDGMNEDRAAWALEAIEAFEAATGTDREDAVGDLLSDLMHWCDRNAVSFEDALRNARSHWNAETGRARW